MNRRTFLQNAACTPVLGAIAPFTLRARSAVPVFAYAGSEDAIHAFAIGKSGWKLLETVPSRSPSFLSVHPGGKYLYAANEIDEHEGNPQATVEVYGVDAATGRLEFLNRRPLSLSATRPRHLAVSSDGKILIAAAHGGGAYNVFSLEEDGTLGEITGIWKEVGCGPQKKYQSSAHPHSLVLHPGGEYWVASDLGCDRISTFRFADGNPVRKAGVAAFPGSGPGALAFHPSGLVLYVIHELRPSISCRRFYPDTGRIGEPFQTIAGKHPERPSDCALAISGDGGFLYSAVASENAITVWKIDPACGLLSEHDVWKAAGFSPRGLHLTEAGQRLYSLDAGSGAIVRLSIDAANRKLGDPARVARVNAPRALVMV